MNVVEDLNDSKNESVSDRPLDSVDEPEQPSQ